MDIPAYISSGILESYVLGLTSPEETKEVETLSAQYPAIRIELNGIEDALNDYASLYSKMPPDYLKEKVFAAADARHVQGNAVREAKVVSVSGKEESSPAWKWFAVAASIALLASGGYNYRLYLDLEAQKNASAIASEDLSNLKDNFNKALAETERIRKSLDIMMKPGTKMIEMKGLEKSPSSLAVIYYNQNTNEVFLNVQNLPMPSPEKQYQLWAIVDGAPVDIGVFDLAGDKMEIHRMKDVLNPQAFAITLEKKGGSPAPTMEEMYVMGKNG